jgi:hypothetical protein
LLWFPKNISHGYFPRAVLSDLVAANGPPLQFPLGSPLLALRQGR